MKTLSLIAALGLSGCFWATTKSEGEKMRADITALNARLDVKEKALDSQIAQLQKVLDDATKLLKRNSADLGADVDQLRSDVRTASGLVAAVNNTLNELRASVDAQKARLDTLEGRTAQIESGKPTANSSPEDLWRLGSTAYEAGRYAEAVELFKRLATTYPTHDRTDDAIYFRGQSHGKLKEWEKAIGVYQQLLEKFPDSTYTDDGLYFAALAAQSIKQCTEARSYLALIKSKFGSKSNVTKEAAELDAQIKKDAKNKSKCAG